MLTFLPPIFQFTPSLPPAPAQEPFIPIQEPIIVEDAPVIVPAPVEEEFSSFPVVDNTVSHIACFGNAKGRSNPNRDQVLFLHFLIWSESENLSHFVRF